MGLALVSEEYFEDDGGLGGDPAPRTESRMNRAPPPPQANILPQIIAVLGAIAAIVGARFLVGLAAIGAFVLALQALTAPNAASLLAQLIFDLTVFAPIVYLAMKGRI